MGLFSQTKNQNGGWQVKCKMPSCQQQGRAFLDDLLAQLQSFHWPVPDVFGIHLAVEEALTNAILHGNKGNKERAVEINCRLDHYLFHIEIADEGQGFDPADVPDPTVNGHICQPGGRGLMLMRCYMNSVEHNAQGNRVVMHKERK